MPHTNLPIGFESWWLLGVCREWTEGVIEVHASMPVPLGRRAYQLVLGGRSVGTWQVITMPPPVVLLDTHATAQGSNGAGGSLKREID
jgi:hypothetical protein